MNSTAGIHAGAVLEAIRERRSTRRFRPEAVPHELLTELLEAARWSPSADNAQPWYLVVIRDDATRRRLNAVAAESRNLYELWSSSLPEAGRLATLPDFLEVPLCLAVFADPRQSPAYVEGEQSHILAAGLAIENIWLLAHARGLSACLWSHLEQDQMKCVLGVPHHYYFAGVLGLGYSLPDHDQPTKERQRKPLDEIVGYEWFKTRSGQAPPADKLALVRDFLHYQETLDGC